MEGADAGGDVDMEGTASAPAAAAAAATAGAPAGGAGDAGDAGPPERDWVVYAGHSDARLRRILRQLPAPSSLVGAPMGGVTESTSARTNADGALDPPEDSVVDSFFETWCTIL